MKVFTKEEVKELNMLYNLTLILGIPNFYYLYKKKIGFDIADEPTKKIKDLQEKARINTSKESYINLVNEIAQRNMIINQEPKIIDVEYVPVLKRF